MWSVSWGNCLKYLKKGGRNRKEGRENKDLTNGGGGQAVSKGGFLKNGGRTLEPP